MFNSRLSYKSALTFVAALLICAAAMPAWAQAYKRQVSFMEEFATRLYERGDYENAWKEFSRLSQMDPQNSAAQKYLALITEKTGKKPLPVKPDLSRLDVIIADITALKQNLIEYEKANQDLEYLIRNLITENDELYAMLYKRSLDLAELRSKHYGTPYGEAYSSLMKQLPPDRVPQRVHQSNDLLALIKDQPSSLSPAATADATQELVNDVVKQKQGTTPSTTTQAVETAADKRNLMVEKAVTTLNKLDSLDKLKEHLSEINLSLKALDKYYDAIKADIAEEKFNEQKRFADLMVDYSEKLKEIETLKTQIASSSNNITVVQNNLTQQNNDLADINAQLAQKDRIISVLRAEIERDEAVMAKQKNDLDLAGTALDQTSSQLTRVENLLNQNGQFIAQVKTGLETSRNNQLKTSAEQTARTEASLNALKTENQDLRKANEERTASFNDLNGQLKSLAENAEQKNRAIQQQQISLANLASEAKHLEKQSAAAEQELAEKNRALRQAQSELAALEKRLDSAKDAEWDHKNTFVGLQKTIASQETEIARLNSQLKSQDQSKILSVSRDENKFLNELVDKKASEIRGLQQQIETLQANFAQSNTKNLQDSALQVEQLKADLAEKERFIQQAVTADSQQKSRIAALEAKQDAIKGVIQKRDMEFLTVSAEAKAKAKELAAATDELNKLKAAVKQQDSLSAALEARLKGKEDDIVNLQNEIDGLRAQATKYHEEIARLNLELNRVKKALNRKP